MSAPPWVASPLPLPPVLPCLLLFLPPPALRAVLWARKPDRHGKRVLLRQQGEWRRLRRLHLPHRTSRRTGRASTDRITRWRWSPWRLLVDSRWLHLSSSQWTWSSTLRAEGRNIPDSTEIHWCSQVHSYWFGCVTRETDWRLLEYRFERNFVRVLKRIHKVHLIRKQLRKGYMSSCGRLTKVQTTTRSDKCGLKYGPKLRKPLRK